MSRSRSRLREQAVVVARVQADARLVEDVEHADEAAADLAGQADALGLAAGERRGRAVERQVVQADVEQEAEPAADLLEQFAGDGLLHRVEAASRTSSNHGTRSPIGMAPTSTSVLPPTRTARACGLSRWPWHVGAAARRACTFRAASAAGRRPSS